MNLFQPLFSKTPEAWQAIICLLLISIYGVLFAFIYTKLKRIDGYYKDTPIAFILMPIVTCALIMGITAISYNFTSSDTVARYARVGAALLSALLILKIRSEQRTPEVLVYYLFLIGLSLLVGLGYLLYSCLVFVFVLLIMIILHVLKFPRISKRRLTLKVTIPEDLNYEHVFDDIFHKYCEINELVRVKSSDLGSLFVLRYEIVLKKGINQKSFLDEIRTRNCNLDISLLSANFETKEK